MGQWNKEYFRQKNDGKELGAFGRTDRQAAWVGVGMRRLKRKTEGGQEGTYRSGKDFGNFVLHVTKSHDRKVFSIGMPSLPLAEYDHRNRGKA